MAVENREAVDVVGDEIKGEYAVEVGTEMDRASGGGAATARGGGGDGLDWRMWERSSLAVGKTREA